MTDNETDTDRQWARTTRRAILQGGAAVGLLSTTANAHIGGDEDTEQWPPAWIEDAVGSILFSEAEDDGEFETDELLLVEGAEQITTSTIRFTQQQ